MAVIHGRGSNAVANCSLKFFNKWKVKINENKLQANIFPFNKAAKIISSRSFALLGKIIPFMCSIQYDRVALDRELCLFEGYKLWYCSVKSFK